MSNAVDDYLSALPAERRAALDAVRAVVNAHKPDAVEEGLQYGIVGWFLPHARYPHGYHCDPKQPLPYAGLGAQKSHLALYLMCAYVDPSTLDWLRGEAAARGLKLDLGKACIRFKRVSELPLDLIGAAIERMTEARFVAAYEAGLPLAVKRKRASRGPC